MSEKGQPLPYRLGACAGCCDLEQQLAQMTQERDKWNENHRVMCRVEHELRQQLVQAQAARTICDVHQAEFDRLEEQLAEATQLTNGQKALIAQMVKEIVEAKS